MRKILLCFLTFLSMSQVSAEDGYNLWLRYQKTDHSSLLTAYRSHISGLLVQGNTPSKRAAKEELQLGLKGILDRPLAIHQKIQQGTLLIGKINEITKLIGTSISVPENKEGFVIRTIRVHWYKTVFQSPMSMPMQIS